MSKPSFAQLWSSDDEVKHRSVATVLFTHESVQKPPFRIPPISAVRGRADQHRAPIGSNAIPGPENARLPR